MMMILVTSFEDLRNDWALSQQEGSFLFNDLRAEESESFFAINDDYQMRVIISKRKESFFFLTNSMPMAMMAIMNNLKMLFFCDQ